MKPIYKNLYQFSIYIPQMDFTIHQYLLASDPAILFAAGTVQQAEKILPQIMEILAGKELKYIFASHVESDECGGVSVFLKKYPNVKVICSMLAARELPGYGYQGELMPVTAEKNMLDGELDLQFFDYPSEVHLQNGVVCLEKNSGVFYSADLMLRYGNGVNQAMQVKWKDEVASIDTERIPSPDSVNAMKDSLSKINPDFIAVGHGFCMECE